VRVGVTLPTFRDDALAIEAARQAEQLGLDGVFSFDHLWPIGAPERPALSCFPVLGAVAAPTGRISFGPLVARIGLVPDEILVAELLSLDLMAPGRLIAGSGPGTARARPRTSPSGSRSIRPTSDGSRSVSARARF